MRSWNCLADRLAPARVPTTALVALYAVLAIASTWPLAKQLDSQIPLGALESPAVSFVSIWTLWWTSDRLPVGFADYWDAPIFHPTKGSFSLSEPMPLLGIVAAPLFWAGASPALIYNLVALAALVLNGLVAFGLMRSLRLHRGAAAIGGAMMVVLPYSHREIGNLQLVPLAGILLTLWALLNFARRPSPTRGVQLGAAFASAYLICGQPALFLVLAAAPASVWLIRRSLFRPASLLALAAACLTCAALIGPVAMAQIERFGEQGFERTPREVFTGAASLDAWRASATRPFAPTPQKHPPAGSFGTAHFPGAAKLALALLGVVWGLSRAEHRRTTAFLATLGLVAMWISALPRLEMGNGSVYLLLRDAMPGIAQIRAFYRAGALTQVAVVLLAAQTLHALLMRGAGADFVGKRMIRASSIAAVALASLTIFELWPKQREFSPTPSLDAWRPWTSWVTQNIGPDEVMAYFPFTHGPQSYKFTQEARWMLLQIDHGRVMVNGFSSYVPESRREFARSAAGFPSEKSHQLMHRYGVRWVVVHLPLLRQQGRPAPAEPRWRRVHFDETHRVAVYEVVSETPSTLPILSE
jgi:hypothetical protein